MNQQWVEHRRAMKNLVRISKVGEELPDCPIRLETFRTWARDRKHRGLFCKIGGRVFLRVDKFVEMVAASAAE